MVLRSPTPGSSPAILCYIRGAARILLLPFSFCLPPFLTISLLCHSLLFEHIALHL